MRPIIACLALTLLITVSACSGGDKDSFRNVDHDRNGKISYEELLFVFPDVTPEVFAQLDKNGDGSLSEDEYKAFLKSEAAAAAGPKPTPAPAAPKAAPAQQAAPAQAQTPPNAPNQLSVPYRGEDVIEIPAPGSGQNAKAKPEKGKKDAREQKAKTEAAAKGEATQYTVLRHDNLSRIAHKFGLSVEDIVRANGNMNPDTLRDGQVLNIPARP